MSVKLKKAIKERIQDIKDQRDVIGAILDEFVTEAKSSAEPLLSTHNHDQISKRYVEVMQHLDRCYHTLVLLTAEAEEKIGGGAQCMGEDDSFTDSCAEGNDDHVTVAKSLPDISLSKTSRRTLPEASADVQCQTLRVGVGDKSTKNVASGDTAKSVDKSSKIDLLGNLEKHSTLDSDTAANRSSADITVDVLAAQISGKLSDDVNLNRQANKPSIVKGVFNIITPEQGTVVGAVDTIKPEQNIVKGVIDAIELEPETIRDTSDILNFEQDTTMSALGDSKPVLDSVPEIDTLKHSNTTFAPNQFKSEQEALKAADNKFAVAKEDRTEINQESGLRLSPTDSLSLQGFRTSGQPKLDIEVARRFLQGVIQQANQDNMRLTKEKRSVSEEKSEEKGLIQEKSLKSMYLSDGPTKEAPVSMTVVEQNKSKAKHQSTETEHRQNVVKKSDVVGKQHNWREEQDNTEIKFRKHTKAAPVDTGQMAKNSTRQGDNVLEESETKCKVLVDCDQSSKNSQSKQPATEVAEAETGADIEIRVLQGGIEYEHVSKESENVVKESMDAECAGVYSRTDSVQEKTDVKGVVSDKLTDVQEKESNKDKTDSELRAGVVEDDYGLGPDLSYEVLENSRIHSVVVSEAISPWSFYVQKFTIDLDDLMKELRGFEDPNPIQTPKEGMFCLAQFSKDGCFYRAKVVEICSKGSDPFVQVFFLDYGNSESRKWSHLRRLPEKFARLPVQGILCALTQVMPDNKYGIWTEDNITLFSQIVSGKRFNCMPYYVSNNPGQPSIVGLFFNIPERVIKDGNIVMQPGPKQISIHEYMVEKGLAKAVRLEEQCRLLDCSKEKEEPIHSVKKDEGDLAQRDADNRKKEQTENVHSQSIVSVASSMETLSDSTHSVPRLPKSTTRDERERRALEEKTKQETRSRQKGNRDKQGKAKSATTAGKGSEDTQKCKAKKQHGEPRIEEAWDSSGPVCSTPVSEDRGCNNLNVDKSQATASGKVPENQHCVQNITEIKLGNLADDCVSVRSSESESVQYTVDQSVNLPTNIDVDMQGLKVMLSYVKSPSSFYVHLVSEMCAKTIDDVHVSLNKTMEQMSRKQQQKMNKCYKPCVGDLCCVLFADDNQYYRGLVTGLEMASPTKAAGNTESLPENVGKVNIFYLDFGNDEVVPKRRVFPLPSQYADVPGLAIHACLAYIQPSISRDSPKKNAQWTDEAVQKFISVTGFDSPLNMIIVDGDIQKMLENHPSVVVKTPPLQVLLVDSCKEEEEEEDVCVNMDLIRQGMARLCATGNSSQEAPASDQQADTSPDGLKDWNPMLEDFMDVRNSYKVDVDDAGVATVGIKVQDEKKICKYYQKNKCWRGDRCPYRHIIVREGALTGDVDYVYGDVMEEYHQDSLPDPGTWIACEVSTIVNPAHFYIVLPFGKEPLASLEPAKKEEGYSSFHQETLEDLMASLQEFYGGKHFEGSYVDYAPGEMVIARYSVDLQWCRARVISSGDGKVEVFYVDFGNKEFVLDTSIRNIDPQFLHLPFQALECFLVDIEPVGGTDRFTPEAKYEFRRLVDGKTLVAYIKSRSWSGCAWVELFDTSGEDDISIAQSLIERGLAQESTALSSSTSGRGSNTSSRVSSEESLVLLPG